MRMPFTRDWLTEAFRIAKGDQSIKPKKEHVKAVITHIEVIMQSESQLRLLMRTAYEAAIQRRRDNGLSIPPTPAFMQGPSLPSAAEAERIGRIIAQGIKK